MKGKLLLPLSALLIVLAGLLIHNRAIFAQDDVPLQPIAVTATADVPRPTPVPELSSEAKLALRYVAEQYHISEEQLIITNQHRREYSEIGRTFLAFTLLDSKEGQIFKLMVDVEEDKVIEDIESIEKEEAEALQQKYGKLEPVLHARLQYIDDKQLLPVAIWMVAGAGEFS